MCVPNLHCPGIKERVLKGRVVGLLPIVFAGVMLVGLSLAAATNTPGRVSTRQAATNTQLDANPMVSEQPEMRAQVTYRTNRFETTAPIPTTTHIVLGGETASLVAGQYGLSLVDLIRFNPGLETNPSLVYPGETLALTAGATSSLSPRTKPTLDSVRTPVVAAQKPVPSVSPAQGGVSFRVTGYTCPPYCGRTASGAQVSLGQVAVDPRVIPLGATVVIQGLGTFQATDTGGDIKGNWIDVFVGGDLARAYQITGYYLVNWY